MRMSNAIENEYEKPENRVKQANARQQCLVRFVRVLNGLYILGPLLNVYLLVLNVLIRWPSSLKWISFSMSALQFSVGRRLSATAALTATMAAATYETRRRR